jgi:hypothetical protein
MPKPPNGFESCRTKTGNNKQPFHLWLLRVAEDFINEQGEECRLVGMVPSAGNPDQTVPILVERDGSKVSEAMNVDNEIYAPTEYMAKLWYRRLSMRQTRHKRGVKPRKRPE